MARNLSGFQPRPITYTQGLICVSRSRALLDSAIELMTIARLVELAWLSNTLSWSSKFSMAFDGSSNVINGLRLSWYVGRAKIGY